WANLRSIFTRQVYCRLWCISPELVDWFAIMRHYISTSCATIRFKFEPLCKGDRLKPDMPTRVKCVADHWLPASAERRAKDCGSESLLGRLTRQFRTELLAHLLVELVALC